MFLINFFLEEAKRKVKEDKFDIYKTKKNEDTFRELRRELGITYNDFQDEIKDTIMELTIKNYCKGPEDDHNKERGKFFWIFGKKVFGYELYLKFTIEEENDEKVLCWSSHIPEYPMIYPYKGGK